LKCPETLRSQALKNRVVRTAADFYQSCSGEFKTVRKPSEHRCYYRPPKYARGDRNHRRASDADKDPDRRP
jgi:predicted DNA binding protein